MAEFCRECFKDYIVPGALDKYIVVSEEECHCEGCGKLKRVVLEYDPKEYMYLVTLKLDEPKIRLCYRLRGSYGDGEYITHSAFGWYDVRVLADSQENAIIKAKENLAAYKDVRVEDFFENTSHPESGELDFSLVCPECQRRYVGRQISCLDYYVCPACRRRCKFEKVHDSSEVRRINQIFSDMFDGNT